jgi:hypothetical protein
MASPDDPRKLVQEWRARAQRTRHLAKGLTQDADRARLHEYAEELEKRAAELGLEAGAPITSPPQVTQPQRQVQQQHAKNLPRNPEKPKP